MSQPSIKRHVFGLLFLSPESGRFARWLNIGIMALIIANVGAVMLETVEGFQDEYGGALKVFEVFSVLVFTIEYALRLWVCTADKNYRGWFRGRLRYLLSPYAVIDFLSIAPFYAPMLLSVDLRFIRVLRLLRFLRILKLARYSHAMEMIARVIKRTREELLIISSLVFIMLILVCSLMYFVEHAAQPEAFSSIPAALWWGVATLTTVGYGDIYPVTPLGKLCASVMAVLAIGIFALPAGIISSGFMEEIAQNKKRGAKPKICPHCGKGLPPESEW